MSLVSPKHDEITEETIQVRQEYLNGGGKPSDWCDSYTYKILMGAYLENLYPMSADELYAAQAIIAEVLSSMDDDED